MIESILKVVRGFLLLALSLTEEKEEADRIALALNVLNTPSISEFEDTEEY